MNFSKQQIKIILFILILSLLTGFAFYFTYKHLNKDLNKNETQNQKTPQTTKYKELSKPHQKIKNIISKINIFISENDPQIKEAKTQNTNPRIQSEESNYPNQVEINLINKLKDLFESLSLSLTDA
ncbi:hypothetical protein ['Catharanthus roseus' aster yellows phytoplasma]|uniref:Uncharacterized protein n=1 Tax='Catharanthus roseus' aster yellows phytoplasma TaxID=1193712 RepID=A0A4P6MDM3_9MOLU|nr:hypothetical protein ['Catharanthus roseus' aster yellows phytoplasma]QBF23685.1 hypothetical protein EXT02_00375 ['Catharanthus roseus' aster yellows phytoplasma]